MPRSFNGWMQDHQIKWRQNHIQDKRLGWQNGKQYEWILPASIWEQGLWPGIRSGSGCSVKAYLQSEQVQHHRGVHNLKSSWASGVNLYYPFGATQEGRYLLATFLQQNVDHRVQTVNALELEYAEDGPLHPSVLLGEKGGSRGAGQTSPDLAFIVNGGSGLILIENKLVEHSFYRCSARTTNDSSEKPGNPDPARCVEVSGLLVDHRSVCHQAVWGRKYWDILLPIVNQGALLSLQHCPAAYGGYQLFRQQALAEGIASSGKYDFVVSCVALDERNERLAGCLKRTGIADLKRDWPPLFCGKAGFTVFTHQLWVDWVREHDVAGRWQPWLHYISERYGY